MKTAIKNLATIKIATINHANKIVKATQIKTAIAKKAQIKVVKKKIANQFQRNLVSKNLANKIMSQNLVNKNHKKYQKKIVKNNL